jgi:hypothetical protein
MADTPFTLSNYSGNSSYGLPYNPQMLSQNLALPYSGNNISTFNTMATMQNPGALTLTPGMDYSIGSNFQLPSSSSSNFFGGISDWLGSDTAKGLGSILGPVASIGSAYLNYTSAQDALDEQKKQNAYLQKFANTQLANEVNTLRNRAGDIEAMRNWSITGNTDAVTPEQLAAWDTKGKEEANLKTMD